MLCGAIPRLTIISPGAKLPGPPNNALVFIPVIGLVDIGGTKLLAAAFREGVRTKPIRRPTPHTAPQATVIEMLEEVAGGKSFEKIAMAFPGPFDRSSASFLNPPGLPPAWQQLALGEIVAAHFGCAVLAENDANCAALAEWTEGAGQGTTSMTYLTISTGVGTGAISSGRLITGRADTEGGHQVLWPRFLGGPSCDCGGYGCLETLISGRAILRRFGTSPEALTSQAAWDEIGRWAGIAVANITALYDPEIVVIGGGVAAQWDRFHPSLMRTVEEHLHLLPSPAIVRGVLEEDRNLWGALRLALDSNVQPVGTEDGDKVQP